VGVSSMTLFRRVHPLFCVTALGETCLKLTDGLLGPLNQSNASGSLLEGFRKDIIVRTRVDSAVSVALRSVRFQYMTTMNGSLEEVLTHGWSNVLTSACAAWL
jgi:hypothetical protein